MMDAVQFHDAMLSINEGNIGFVQDTAERAGYLIDDMREDFMKFVYITSFVRPRSNRALALMLSRVKGIQPIILRHFVKYLIDDPLKRVKMAKNILLYRSLYEIGVIDRQFINEQILFVRLHLEMYPRLVGQILPFACHFCDLFPPDIITRFMKFNSQYLDLLKLGIRLHDSFHYYFTYAVDNSRYKLELSPLVNSIVEDDVTAVQEIVSQPSFDVNGELEIWEHHPFFIHGTTLIDAAAFYGSIKTFKYLLLNGSRFDVFRENEKVTRSTGEYVIAGGNLEIIRIMEQSHYQFGKHEMLVALMFHHNEIHSWLRDKLNLEIESDSVFAASLTNNLEFFINDEAQFEGKNMWPVAKYGFVELVEFFGLSSDQMIDKGKKLFDYVAKYRHVSIIKHLINSGDYKQDVYREYLTKEDSELEYKDYFVLVHQKSINNILKWKLTPEDAYTNDIINIVHCNLLDFIAVVLCSYSNGYMHNGTLEKIPTCSVCQFPPPPLHYLKYRASKISEEKRISIYRNRFNDDDITDPFHCKRDEHRDKFWCSSHDIQVMQ